VGVLGVEGWRKRHFPPTAQFKTQSKVPDDFLREQADEVRISRQSRIVIGKDFLRSRRAADVIVLFQKQNTQTRASKVARCYKTIVSRAQDYDIVLRFHFQFCCELMVTSNIAKLPSRIGLSLRAFLPRALSQSRLPIQAVVDPVKAFPGKDAHFWCFTDYLAPFAARPCLFPAARSLSAGPQ
jgi:hypothetical protein